MRTPLLDDEMVFVAELPIAFDPEKFWIVPYEDAATPEGVSREELQAWEAEHGFQLPESLKKVLEIQNGGYAFSVERTIFPLSELRDLTDCEWDEICALDETTIRDRSKLIAIGRHDAMCAVIVLSYLDRLSPAVFFLHRNLGDELRRAADSLDELWNKFAKSVL